MLAVPATAVIVPHRAAGRLVADELQQRGWHCPGGFERRRDVLVLLLPHPANLHPPPTLVGVARRKGERVPAD